MKRKKLTSKPKLNIYEQKIAKILLKSKVKLTTSQIADTLNIDWRLCKKNLESLYRKAPISRQTMENRIYWYVKRR